MGIRNYCFVLTILLATFFCPHAKAQHMHSATAMTKQQWVDSVYNHLTPEERIGQLFMVAAYSGGNNYNEDQITQLIQAHQIGGLIFMQGTPPAQGALTNKYQAMAQVPLLIGMDGEWGLGMRLTGVKDYPKQMMIGATRDTALMRHMGIAVAKQCLRMGVNIDFAPVVDVNNNPNNPVINFRSFGEDKTRVAQMGIAYMDGLQQMGIIACAKHFPGHGDTNVDSHKDLPVINKSLAELDTLELYPFRKLIHAGVKSIMVAHLDIPALVENEPHMATTLSKNTVTGLLRDKMGFKGLIFTDALNMQGVAKYFGPGEVDLKAFLAGNDVLLFSQDVPTAINKIKNAIDSGVVQQTDLEERVKKILSAKYDAGLAHFTPIDTTNITEDLNKYTDVFYKLIAKEAVTVARDDNGIINKINKNMRIGYIGVNADSATVLYQALRDSLGVIIPNYWLPNDNNVDTADLFHKMQDMDAVIVGVHNMHRYPGHNGNYGLSDAQMTFIKEAGEKDNVMITVLGNPYVAQGFCDANSLMVTYEDDTITEHTAADVLLRNIKAFGHLPVTPCEGMPSIAPPPEATAMVASKLKKTLYPVDAGVVKPNLLFKLNLFIQRCIVDGVFPGCRIVAARNGIVFYDKAFGYYTYAKQQRVDSNTLYDVASLTKVLSTDLAVMHLYDQGKLKLNETVGHYLSWTRGTDKANLKIRDLLLHQAGLKSWIPFYKATLDATGEPDTKWYRHTPEKGFNIPVAKNLYLRNDYTDTMWHIILESPLENRGRYVYSDLDYYFLAAIVQHITHQRLDLYVEKHFYKPMGLKEITYNPLLYFNADQIAPTENDDYFRHQQIQGFVHDPGAALFGGVEGHAGIFASADDVAAIFQMLLNDGVYGGKRYIKSSTIKDFTAYNSRISRRGIGFDKPDVDEDNGGPAGDRTTGLAFGHQGFTGTCAWADPGTGIVFVFLSNRVYPTAKNHKINRQNVRTIAQDYIYQSLGFPINHDRPKVYKKDTGISK